MCRTPLGLPVDPEVYRINNGSSASISSGLHSASAVAIASCHQRSRSLTISTVSPVRWTTITCLIDGVSATALSAFVFMGIFCFVPRTPVSWVINTLQAESLIRSRRESGLKAPKTTECTAPMRAQASMATGNWGIICIYRHTRSPFSTPILFKTLANFCTSASNSL